MKKLALQRKIADTIAITIAHIMLTGIQNQRHIDFESLKRVVVFMF